MNVASLELSKELYELSGWEDVSNTHVFYGTHWDISKASMTESIGLQNMHLPAYDLGYLLRKLDGFDIQLNYSNQWRTWNCWADDYDGKADTPEDAACKLAIELFKQGVLTR